MGHLAKVFNKARCFAVDEDHERLRKGTHRASKHPLAPASKVNQAVVGELLAMGFHRASREERERELTRLEQDAGVFYCRRCGEECSAGVCPEHGRQYGIRGA